MDQNTAQPAAAGAPDSVPRVTFGPGPTDTMPADWASRGLTWLREHEPQAFIRMMSQGVFGIEPAANGRRRGGQ